jgi:hypothetical protein
MGAMTFRQVALSMPEAVEAEHMGHPDFRVQGKIFATLFTREGEEFGMVKLTPAQQRVFVGAKPKAFEPIKGGWGRQGCTQVRLDSVDKKSLRNAIFTAWCNAASKRLVDEHGD